MRTQALELHQSGRLDDAAALYQKVLASWPDDTGVRGNLAVIRLLHGRELEALRYIHQACELCRWSDPGISRNFGYILRAILVGLDCRKQAIRWRQYLGWRQEGFNERLPVSVLIPELGPELDRLLFELANQQLVPCEVLVAGDAGSVPAGMPFPVRSIVSLAAEANRYARINALSARATGDWLLAMRAGDVIAPDYLLRMSNAMAAVDSWAYCDSSVKNEPFVTPGYQVLRRDAQVAGGAGLLVSKKLHELIGGYIPRTPDPDIDYCLRLLWMSEPGVAEVGMSRLAMRSIEPTRRKAAASTYLDMALMRQESPNPFAPCAHHWGMSFYRFVMNQDWELSQDAVRRIVSDIENHLSRAEQRTIRPQPGLNLVGSALGEFGLSENLRAFARAAGKGAIPNRIVDIEFGSARRGDFSLLDRLCDEGDYRCSVFFFNPDISHLYRHSLDSLVFRRRSLDFRHRKIGYWAWEMERLPQEWLYALDRVDEIWAPTEFVAKAVSAVTDKPVIKIPPPIIIDIKGSYSRATFRLPSDRFLFLYSFSFASYPARKNPEAVVRAFKKAFPDRAAPVSLVLKSVHGTDWPEVMSMLMDEIAGDPRIILCDCYMSRDEVFGLQNICDCYVSLHRSEGFGLGMAESMYLGKPVIGTGYSGNLEFMNEENSGLVRYSMTSVRPGDYLYSSPDYFWAEPDVDHAAGLMVRVFKDRDFRERIALLGRQGILSRFGYEAVAEAMRTRLQEIGES